MSMIKTLSEPKDDRAGLGIETYLHHGSKGDRRERALALAASADVEKELGEETHGWHGIMDETQQEIGNDKCRRIYHFMISPDPEDHVTVEEVLDMAREWAERAHPDGQWVIVIHDDKQNPAPPCPRRPQLNHSGDWDEDP
ncbi:MAG: hypothetical protein PHR15_01210 [Atopobiaceae bacterium]|jgi:hypothetical protein|nr:hypothetical protein [Atopobiaceae bacterium]MCH4181258.1 hypothetical protein [Atopobiaceae bacterium]MCH4214788.1 hypothetical protein [Atopobiaceae bacterium]MCH4276824.1 hypothetical protein [Atopobiaceae bacterium]MCI1226169.1 hypothetical protein [Atopobiaceae bacterium]